MFDWLIDGAGALFGFIGDAVSGAIGWAWDKIVTGIFTWLANGLALVIEWVWSILDSSTTPRVTQDWYRNELAGRVGVIALAVTMAMMLASGMQAALAGRPEQIGDAVKSSVRSLVCAGLTITVVDHLIGAVDEASELVWQTGRADLVALIEGVVAVATAGGPLVTTFVGPLCLLFGFIGLLGLVVSLMMRSALIYLAAAMAPIVWSVDVLPIFRGSARKLVHLTVSLIVSKLAIVITLVISVKLIANPTGESGGGTVLNDGAAAVGTLMTGFVCFLIAAVSPVVLYKVMPTVENAVVSSGVAGGWVRGATTAAHTALMVKSLGASTAASAATRPIAQLHRPSPSSSPSGSGSAGHGSSSIPPRRAGIDDITAHPARPAATAAASQTIPDAGSSQQPESRERPAAAAAETRPSPRRPVTERAAKAER